MKYLLLSLTSMCCSVMIGQYVDVDIPEGWDASETVFFVSADEYVIALEKKFEQSEFAVLFRSPKIPEKDQLITYIDKPKPYFGLAVDWETASYYLIYDKGPTWNEAVFDLSKYTYTENGWQVMDLSRHLNPDYLFYEANIADLSSSGGLILPLSYRSTTWQKEIGSGLLTVYETNGDSLKLIAGIEGSEKLGLLGQSYDSDDEMETIVLSEEAVYPNEEDFKGRIITMETDGDTYRIVDTLEGTVDGVRFGKTIQLYQNQLFVASSSRNSEIDWTYQLDRYERVETGWNHVEIIHRSIGKIADNRPWVFSKEKYIEVENGVLAYFTFEDKYINVNVASIDSDGSLKDNRVVYQTMDTLYSRLPSLDLSADGKELLVSGVLEGQRVCGAVIVNSTLTNTDEVSETDISLKQNPIEDKIEIVSDQNIEFSQLFSVTGQSITSSKSSVIGNLGYLPAGTYYLRVLLVSGEVQTLKLIKI